MADFVLYSYFRSSASYRVRIALNLKSIPYTYSAVHLVQNGGEQYSASYAALNPSREVPTLVHKGRSLSQSVAIIQYLDAIHPQPLLFPGDPYSRARILQVCEIINSGIQPIANLKVLTALEKQCQFDQRRKADWSAYWIRDGLLSLEKLIKQTSQDYCFGSVVTAADCFLVPQIYNAIRYKVDLQEFPRLNEIYKNCQLLAAFQTAAPEVQPDTPT